MTQSKIRAATVGGVADDVEAVFYDALQKGDIVRLMACWADEDDIVCVHPGGPRMVGAGEIRAAFEAMFAHGPIRAVPERLRKIASLVSAVHSLVERVQMHTPDGMQEAFVTATNVYHKTAQGWRLVAHHASPGQQHDTHAAEGAGQVLH